MLTICYRIITAAAAALVIAELYAQKDIKLKINTAIIVIPLVLRALMII
ncbi:MAG: hypothetical protein NT061_12265 [Spirochaetes bacterium]|nr:hypothetical protein [Spirochaetota bacterium]